MRQERPTKPAAIGFPMLILLGFVLAWSPLSAQSGSPETAQDIMKTPAGNGMSPSSDGMGTSMNTSGDAPSPTSDRTISSFSPEPFPSPGGTGGNSPMAMGGESTPGESSTILFTDTGIATDSSKSASEAALLQAKADAEAQEKLKESIRAVQKRLQEEASDDLHLSPDGRTIIWKVRSAAKASDLTTTAQAVLGGKVKAVKGFESFNSLLIEMSTPSVENLESILEFIGQVDKPQKQVFIKVLIAEMQVLDSQSWGGQLELLKAAIDGSDLSGTISVNHSLSTAPAEAAAAAGFKLFLISGQIFRKFLYAQQANSEFKILSHPQIVATHGKLAKVQVGQEVNVRKNTSYRDGVVTIEYGKVPVGLSLSVTPYLQSDGIVSMDIMQTISSLDSYDDTLNLANTTNRLIETSASARMGQTVVLAGIIQKRKQRARAGVPVLSRIPGIGKLFDRSDSGEQRIELLVFLTPEAVHSGDRVPAASPAKGRSVSADVRNLREVRAEIEGRTPADSGKQGPTEASGKPVYRAKAAVATEIPKLFPSTATPATKRPEPLKDRLRQALQRLRTPPTADQGSNRPGRTH